MKKQTKNYMLITGLLVFAFILLPNVNGAIAMSTPPANYNESANFDTSWTFVNITDGITSQTSANSSFYWNSTGSWVAITKSGFTCTATSCSATLDISTMGEGAGVINFTAGNSTLILGGTLSTNIRVDKTNPSITITLPTSSAIQNKDFEVTWSATDTLSGVNSTAVSISVVGDNNCIMNPLTYSTNSQTVTLTGSQTQCAGLHTISITSIDTSGLSTTTTSNYNIYHPSGGSATIPNLNPQGQAIAQPPVITIKGQSILDAIINWFKNLFQ